MDKPIIYYKCSKCELMLSDIEWELAKFVICPKCKTPLDEFKKSTFNIID